MRGYLPIQTQKNKRCEVQPAETLPEKSRKTPGILPIMAPGNPGQKIPRCLLFEGKKGWKSPHVIYFQILCTFLQDLFKETHSRRVKKKLILRSSPNDDLHWTSGFRVGIPSGNRFNKSQQKIMVNIPRNFSMEKKYFEKIHFGTPRMSLESLKTGRGNFLAAKGCLIRKWGSNQCGFFLDGYR